MKWRVNNGQHIRRQKKESSSGGVNGSVNVKNWLIIEENNRKWRENQRHRQGSEEGAR
jgi:hypothetical protein